MYSNDKCIIGSVVYMSATKSCYTNDRQSRADLFWYQSGGKHCASLLPGSDPPWIKGPVRTDKWRFWSGYPPPEPLHGEIKAYNLQPLLSRNPTVGPVVVVVVVVICGKLTRFWRITVHRVGRDVHLLHADVLSARQSAHLGPHEAG